MTILSHQVHLHPDDFGRTGCCSPRTAIQVPPRLVASAEGIHCTTTDGRRRSTGSPGCGAATRATAQADHGGDREAGRHARLLAPFHSGTAGVRAREPHRRAHARHARPRLLLQLGLRGNGDGTQDRRCLPARERRRRTQRLSAVSAATMASASAASVGGMVANRRCSGRCSPAWTTCRTRTTLRDAFTRGLPEHGAHLADELERLVALHDAFTIAAVIVEPMAGSTGALLRPKGYLKRWREITRSTHPAHLRRGDHGVRAGWEARSPPHLDVRARHDDFRQAYLGPCRWAAWRAPRNPRRLHGRPPGAIELFHG